MPLTFTAVKPLFFTSCNRVALLVRVATKRGAATQARLRSMPARLRGPVRKPLY